MTPAARTFKGGNLILPEGSNPACPKGSNTRAFSSSVQSSKYPRMTGPAITENLRIASKTPSSVARMVKSVEQISKSQKLTMEKICRRMKEGS